MITIAKGNTHNIFITTLSERLNDYSITPSYGNTFYFAITNQLSQITTKFALVDTSIAYWRYNKFILDETQFNFTNGSYSYSAYADSGYTQNLEIGEMVVTGANSTNPIYL